MLEVKIGRRIYPHYDIIINKPLFTSREDFDRSVCVCVCVCVCACLHACVRACVRACMCVFLFEYSIC